jgi:nicotinamidase/pyrazinamidase
MEPKESFEEGDALIVIDVQKDFCPGGALAVEGGDEVIPVLNRWIEAAEKGGIPVYLSRDWHPENHISFKDQGGDWPPHCIQDTEGAQFHPELRLPARATKVTKGVRFDQDQNSVFDETGLSFQLGREGVKKLWIGGLAQDVCVLKSVLDALKAGFEVNVIGEGTRPVSPEGGKTAIKQMIEAGATIL